MSSGPRSLTATPMLQVAPTGWPSTSDAISSNASADPLGDLHRPVAIDVIERDGEFLAAQPPEQIIGADIGMRGLGKDLQHAVAEGVTVMCR